MVVTLWRQYILCMSIMAGQHVGANPVPINTTINVTAYPAWGENLDETLLVVSNASWFDALEECSTLKSYIAHSGSKGVPFIYIRQEMILRFPELVGQPLWIGFHKPNLDGKWYLGTKCHNPLTYETTFANDNVAERQCALLNTTTNPRPIDYTWYAASCFERHSFICSKTIGTGYLKEYIGMAKLSKDELTYIVVKDNSTLEDCKSNCYSHHRFYCEHNSTASTCAISERDISLYPIEFTLTYVGNDTISYVKTQNEQIDVTTSPVQNITYNFTDLPCYQEPAPPTTTIISTQSAEGDVTSSVSNDVNTAVYISPEYIEQLVVEIKEENTVDVKTLTSYRNKFISANDNRPSSKTIGSIGLIFIALLLGLILVSDVPKFIQDVKTLHGKPAKHTETCDNTFIFTKSKFSMKRRVSFRRNSM